MDGLGENPVVGAIALLALTVVGLSFLRGVLSKRVGVYAHSLGGGMLP